MIIVWGTHRSQKSFGRTHLFCPRCRGVHTGMLVHHVRMPHLYYIPIWRTVTPLRTCESCGLVQRVPKSWRPLQADAAEIAARVGLEERLRAKRLDREQRMELIAEPIEAMEFECTLRVKESSGQKVASIAQFLTLITFVGSVFSVGYFLLETTPAGRNDVLPWVIGTVSGFVICASWAIYSTRRAHFGTVREEILPQIAGPLKSVQPKLEELDETLHMLRKKGSKIARAINADDICDAMH